MKKSIYRLLAISTKKGDLSWYFDIFLISLICLNILALILGTVPRFSKAYHEWFYNFEVFSVIFFTVEYILRIWTANEDPEYKKPLTGNIRYAFSMMAIIDLLAIIPFYLPLFGIDLRVFRIMRLFRLFRLFKLARYIKAISMISKVLRDKHQELIISTLLTLFMLIITSTVMYYVEHDAQPDAFSSIPETMWWSIATLTTVGYGDMYPVTGFGKFLGGIIAILGIGLFALPTGIIASGFSEELAKGKRPAQEKEETEKQVGKTYRVIVCTKCKHEMEV